MKNLIALVLSAFTLILAHGATLAQTNFYQGKTMTFIVNMAAGDPTIWGARWRAGRSNHRATQASWRKIGGAAAMISAISLQRFRPMD